MKLEHDHEVTINTRSNLLASVSHMLQLCVCVSVCVSVSVCVCLSQKCGFGDGKVRVIDSCRAPCSQSYNSYLISSVQ